MVTIKDVARLAGYSPATVSKALNDRSDVSAETKSKILDIVRASGFTPNAFGKALKKKSSGNIGVLFCRDLRSISGNPFYSRVLEGIEAELALNDYNLVLQIITESTKDELPKMTRERQVDGIILVGTFRDDYLKRILNEDLHVVLIDPRVPVNQQCHVLIDNEHGAFQATKYLIDCGHERIGFISGDLTRCSFQQRYNGYIKALKYHHIQPDENLVRTGGLENGYEQVRSLLEIPGITAIFSTNDLNALYGYRAITERGFAIPDDISMVGFDDINLAKIAAPPLTTIRVYKEELGSIAVRSLLGLIQDEEVKPVTTLVPTKLVIRESVRMR